MPGYQRRGAPVNDVRPEERFAFAVVGSVLPGTVEPYDRCGRQRAVDAILHHPDGRKAAIEVSSIGPPDEAAIINYLGTRGHCKTVAGVNRRWLVQVPRSFHPADIRKIEMVLSWCEARGAEHLGELAGEGPEVDDLLRQGVRADAITSTASRMEPAESRVYFMLPPMGGFSGRGLVSLPGELAAALRTPQIQKRISKLVASGLEERHLVLIVRPSAFSWPVYEALAFGGPLPTEAPLLLDGLSQVWLLTGLQAGGVVRGISGRGWYRDHLLDRLDDLTVKSIVAN
jgi:hypothetical protein